MPILAPETNLQPSNLLDLDHVGGGPSRRWWAVYTLSRREKEFMRRLQALQGSFYCPIIPQRGKSPAGRMRISYLPLFTNYVFLCGDENAPYQAMTTNCVSQCVEVIDGEQLTQDLRQIRDLIDAGIPVTRESRLDAGDAVRVKTGNFRGYEGKIIQREGQTRLLVAVKFMQQGASVVLEDCEVEPL